MSRYEPSLPAGRKEDGLSRDGSVCQMTGSRLLAQDPTGVSSRSAAQGVGMARLREIAVWKIEGRLERFLDDREVERSDPSTVHQAIEVGEDHSSSGRRQEIPIPITLQRTHEGFDRNP